MKIDEYAISDGLLWKAWAGGQASPSLRARRETERKSIGGILSESMLLRRSTFKES